MIMSAPIRMAIAGYGYIAHVHAKAAQAADGVSLVGVMGRDGDKGRQFANTYGLDKTWTSEEALLADDTVEAVVIALPNALHASLGCRLLEAGKHVLVEKPMACDAKEACWMEETAQRTGLALMVGHMWRFDREALLLRQIIEDGELGEVVKTKGYGIHQAWGPSGWFTDKALAGGGALIDMGIHALDTVRFLLGDPTPLNVYAQIETRYGDYDVDDAGILVVRWSCNTTSVIESGWWHPHMDGAEASTQLFGTRGYARLFPTSITRMVDGESSLHTPSFPTRLEHCDPHIYEGQMIEFAAAIDAQRTPNPGPSHGRVMMDICDAAYHSSQTGRVIEL
jgi:predicted dehydrogenase